MNLRKKCLETALKYTSEDRNAAHGDPEDNFRNIAAFWNAHLRTRYPWIVSNDGASKDLLDATDVALMMAGMKAARLAFNPMHEDSWVDLAGYAACGMGVALRHAEGPLEGHRFPLHERPELPFAPDDEPCPAYPHRHSNGMIGDLPVGSVRTETCPIGVSHRHADGRMYIHGVTG